MVPPSGNKHHLFRRSVTAEEIWSHFYWMFKGTSTPEHKTLDEVVILYALP